jgi:NAD-dependent deacetylase
MNHPSLVILTGAGISAESGLKTFRDHNGLWESHRVEEVASLTGFRHNPEVVQRFYNERRAQLLDPSVRPNAAHVALARLEQEWQGDFLLVTQNVDNLHERAGSQKIIHMHGELLKARCLKTGEAYHWNIPIASESRCPCCDATGSLRPHIVWFGEMPLGMDRINRALKKSQIFVAIGTSGNVYPAAGFVKTARAPRKIEINAEKSQVSNKFNEHRVGPASETVPRFVEELISSPNDVQARKE